MFIFFFFLLTNKKRCINVRCARLGVHSVRLISTNCVLHVAFKYPICARDVYDGPVVLCLRRVIAVRGEITSAFRSVLGDAFVVKSQLVIAVQRTPFVCKYKNNARTKDDFSGHAESAISSNGTNNKLHLLRCVRRDYTNYNDIVIIK
jgi:hypothetical protein